jgi:hypothetical protein
MTYDYSFYDNESACIIILFISYFTFWVGGTVFALAKRIIHSASSDTGATYE